MASSLNGKTIAFLVAPRTRGADRTTPPFAFMKSFFDAGKPVAVICHGPWTLIEADVVRGRTITSWPSVASDPCNAGANWVDDEVIECSRGPNTLVSSRKPADLPAFLLHTGWGVRQGQLIARTWPANVKASVISRTC
jgi:putative intracellular protease/amidase